MSLGVLELTKTPVACKKSGGAVTGELWFQAGFSSIKPFKVMVVSVA